MDSPYPYYFPYDMPLRKANVPQKIPEQVVLKGGYIPLFWQWVKIFWGGHNLGYGYYQFLEARSQRYC